MEKFLAWISENSAVICGAFFAFMIAFIQKKGAFMEKISGALLCSLFSTGLYYGVVSFFPAVPDVAAVAIGSFVGFYGVDECKRIILDKINLLLGNKKEKEDKENDETNNIQG